MKAVFLRRAIEPFFDAEFYLAQCAEKAVISDPVMHYILYGAKRGLDPCQEFSTNFYVAQNADVAQRKINPFWHYIKFGRSEGRRAIEDTAMQVSATHRDGDAPRRDTVFGGDGGGNDPDKGIEREVEIISGEFDPTFYRETYSDVPGNDAELAVHFLTIGWLLGHDPTRWFSTHGYLRANPDVAHARLNPFVHYLVYGKNENRPLDDSIGEALEQETGEDLSEIIETIRPHFDTVFYLKANQDVADAGIDPLRHYCEAGCFDGRDPHPGFSSAYYLAANPDVRDAGINPYWHYIVTGKNEKRFGRHPGGEKIRILTDQQPLQEMVSHWRRNDPAPALLDESALYDKLASHLGNACEKLVVAVSHDDYRLISGGVQLCMQREAKLAAERDFGYLSVFPWQPLPRLAHMDEDPDVILCLTLNRDELGATRTSTLEKVLSVLCGAGQSAEVVVHQLLGHNPEQVVKIVKACGRRSCLFWLHDFLSMCPNYTLQRNSLDYCGAPSPDSNACMVCMYVEERKPHLERMRRLFEELDVHVVAPSDTTRKLWTQRSGLAPASVAVLPHVDAAWSERKTPRPASMARPVRVGFLGTPIAHKGWTIFERLAGEFAGPDFEFRYFGVKKMDIQGATHIPVRVHSGEMNAMIESVAREEIDLVLHWARWPETFSFTTFEAIFAGAFVITNENSGNVAAAVADLNRGVILKDESDLFEFFSDGRLARAVELRRDLDARFEATPVMSDMSISLLSGRPQS